MTDLAAAFVAQLDDDALDALALKLAPRLRAVGGPDHRMTAAQVAAHHDVDRRTVNRWAVEGRIWAEKIGRQWRFDPAKLDVAPPAAPVASLNDRVRRSPSSHDLPSGHEAAVRAIRG